LQIHRSIAVCACQRRSGALLPSCSLIDERLASRDRICRFDGLTERIDDAASVGAKCASRFFLFFFFAGKVCMQLSPKRCWSMKTTNAYVPEIAGGSGLMETHTHTLTSRVGPKHETTRHKTFALERDSTENIRASKMLLMISLLDRNTRVVAMLKLTRVDYITPTRGACFLLILPLEKNSVCSTRSTWYPILRLRIKSC
jgi:hypothetical protein